MWDMFSAQNSKKVAFFQVIGSQENQGINVDL